MRSAIAAGAFLLLLGCQHAPGPAGRSGSAIIGGRFATAEDLRGTVVLVDPSGALMCTATLVAPTLVVTAAHCLVESGESEALGADLAPADVEVLVAAMEVERPEGGERYRVERVLRHPDYLTITADDPTSLGSEHDIGVLVLERPVSAFEAIPILPMADVDAELTPGRDLVIAGYGDQSEMPPDGHTHPLKVGTLQYERRSDFEILAGGTGMDSPCYGDSGGPAYVDTAAGRRLVGVTSRGRYDVEAGCGAGEIFTLAPAYQELLDEATGGVVDPDPPTADDAGLPLADAGVGGPIDPPIDEMPPDDRRMSPRGGDAGCGCHAARSPRAGGSALVLALVAGTIILGRRRRRS